MSNPNNEYYLSKYALLEGIKKVTCSQPTVAGQYMRPDKYNMHYRLGKDIHVTREAAVIAANKLLEKRKASLKKQLERLDSLKFE